MNYYDYPNAGWWHTKETMAKAMQDSELEYARKDTFVTATTGMPENYGKYMDENSVYIKETQKRSKKGAKS